MSKKSKSPGAPEVPQRPYAALPLCILESDAYISLSHPARSMLIEIVAQHQGNNNGHMVATMSYLRCRGLPSTDVRTRAIRELLEHKLISETKKGGRNAGVTLYGVTWLPVSNIEGLDIQISTSFPLGEWMDFKKSDASTQGVRNTAPATQARTKNANARRSDKAQDRRDYLARKNKSIAPCGGPAKTVARFSSGPADGHAHPVTEPCGGPEIPASAGIAGPPNGQFCNSASAPAAAGRLDGGVLAKEHAPTQQVAQERPTPANVTVVFPATRSKRKVA
ncbi:MAG TPA: hypothetical protein PLX20_01935 [Rhodocyclaceae bacterium]|uniref:hypothetical protein n=1 Tax=Accumulibacter sp. TaxID=2053492 RepID=UPI002B8F625A|nr:hypothetical protein [Accumulibacter sp.]HMZ82666.1 hypothetical protein [Rhodocyclaceae bacterium]HNA02895.1 hypothetical protein [Rhodocyclaceae bacterium]HNB77347.1 hypothetical protein [Rhodocyclaceae bacterium]HNC19943.1 hypothetical protein [Accumulibacter sp.]HNF91177.1 hypothetical protein [Accumulibacter sp.]